MTDPANPGLPAIRIGDAERTRTLDQLTRAHQGGYLDFAEFDERSALVVSARTKNDLDVLTQDLPQTLGATTGPPPPRAASVPTGGAPAQKDPGREARSALGAWLSVTIITNIIWLATSFSSSGDSGYYWPIWPMIGLGIPLILAVVARVTGNQRR